MSAIENIKKGSEITGLFKNPELTTVKVKSDKHGMLEFQVKPINNEIYMKMTSVMNVDPKISRAAEDPKNKNSIVGVKMFADAYYPALKIVLPYSCINPKVVDGEGGDGVINIANLDLDVAISLLEKILDVSGLAKADGEDRKN